MSNKLLSNAIPSQYPIGRWSTHILSREDIHNPGKSVYGFPINAARLAAHQPLMLHCREDEIFKVMGNLNELLGDPAVLGGACSQLAKLQEVFQQKMVQLTELEEQPISEQEALKISQAVDAYLTAAQPPLTMLDRLEKILTPNRLVAETGGGTEDAGSVGMVDTGHKASQRQGLSRHRY